MVQEAELERKLTSSERDKLSKGVTDKTLKRCLQSEDVLNYWEALYSVAEGQEFFNTKYFASKWVAKTIHQPGGGVSNNSIFLY